MFDWIRFIPAGAGNTLAATAICSTGAVYPRWRGEHTCVTFTGRLCSGLSPLARGTPGVAGYWSATGRFIPAGAGNTNPEPTYFIELPVYPRWRGEHTKSIYLFQKAFFATQQSTNIKITISYY